MTSKDTAMWSYIRSDRRWWQLLGLLLVGAFAGGLAAHAPELVLPLLGMGLALLLLVALLVRPGWVMTILLLYVWLLAGRSDRGDLLPQYPIVRWGSYLLIPAFTGLALVRILVRGWWRRSLIEPFVAALAALMAISGLVNHTGLAAVAFSIGIYLRYPLLFLLLVNLQLKPSDYQRALRLFLTIALLLTAEAIFGYTVLGKSGDRAFYTVGTSWGHVTAGLFFLYGSCFVVAHALQTGARPYHLLAIALGLIGSWIALVRSALVLVPVLSLLLYATSRRLVGARRLPLLAIGLLALLILAVFMPWHRLLSAIPALQFFNPGYRFGAVREVLQILSSSKRFLLGFGPRSYSPGSIGQAGEMFQLLVERRGLYFAATVSVSQLVNAFSELGALGFSVYWLMLFALLRMNLRFRRNSLRARANEPSQRGWSILSLAFIGIWFHYAIVGLAYHDVWRTDIVSLVFWACAAAIYGKARSWTLDVARRGALDEIL